MARIDLLEKELKRYRINGTASANQSMALADTANLKLPISSPSPSSSSNCDPESDLADLLGQLSVADNGQVTYFGPRSNFYVTEDSTTEASHIARPPRKAPKVKPRQPTGLTEDVQNDLLELYWTWQHPWMYFVHKKLFLEELRQPGGNYCTSLLLSSILALASRFSDCVQVRSDPTDPNTAGSELAERARQFLSQEMESPTVSTVAAALIIAVRAMAEDKDYLGWTYAGTVNDLFSTGEKSLIYNFLRYG